jgi:hypothetical protein
MGPEEVESRGDLPASQAIRDCTTARLQLRDPFALGFFAVSTYLSRPFSRESASGALERAPCRTDVFRRDATRGDQFFDAHDVAFQRPED